MTNEEHIEQLKKLRSFHNGSYGRSINKAIEALNQQTCEDCIIESPTMIYAIKKFDTADLLFEPQGGEEV